MNAAGGVAMAGIGAAQAADANATAEEYAQMSQRNASYIQDALDRINSIHKPGAQELGSHMPTPQDYKLAGYATPEDAQYQQVSIDPAVRQAQMQALGKLQGVSNGAADSELNLANFNAMNHAQQGRRSNEAAIMQNMASRGTLGSGMELAQRQQAAQNAANNAQSGTMEAARNNALAKLQATNNYLGGMGNLRNQDTSLATTNADIINKFNMANTAQRNRVNEMNTDTANKQSTMNTGQANQYQQYIDEARRNAVQQQYANAMDQGKSSAGIGNSLANFNQSAGATGLAMGANARSGAYGAAGNAAQGIYQGAMSGAEDNSGDNFNPMQNMSKPESTPQAQNGEEMDFIGRK